MLLKPGPRVVFLPNAAPLPLAEALVALANGDGGTIVLGANADGRLVTTIWEEEAEAALREAASFCRPPVPSQFQSIELPTGHFIGIQAPRSTDLHSLADGRVLVRRHDENRPLNGEEIRLLASARPSIDFESEVVAGAKPGDLSTEFIDEYLEKRADRTGTRAENKTQLMYEIGATDREGNPTLIGTLLFGRNPQAFLPQSGIVFVRFAGTEARGEDGNIGYSRREELGGTVAKLIERAWTIVFDEMRVGATVNGLERQDVLEYPRFAVREALVNAVAHRDYRIRGKRIEIRMFADRLEIHSPGGLPGYMTIDNLVDEHYSRNPRLVNGLYQYGFIEELGLGIDHMIEEMVQAGHPAPVFRATPHSFTVVLSNRRERPSIPAWTRNMNERQTRAIHFTRESGSITNREYQQLCPDVSPETLRLDLVDLVKRGVLLKIGINKGTYYILK